MGIVWYVWPINLILGAILTVALITGLWLLGHHIRRVFQTRGDGLRMRDLISLNIEIDEIEAGVRQFCERQEQMLHHLHEMVCMARENQPPQDNDRVPR